MSKLLLFLSLLGLMFMMIGVLLMPQDVIFWFASTAPVYQYIRLVLAVLLAVQLVTDPPRNLLFRLVAGGTSLIIMTGVIQQTIAFNMSILDAFSLLSASLAILITSLEQHERKEANTHRLTHAR